MSDEVWAALESRPIAVTAGLIRLLGPRDAIVLQQIRWRATSENRWVDISTAELGAEVGLSADQTWRAVKRLVDDGIVEWREPSALSRRREYRLLRNRDVDAAKPRTPDAAESSPPPSPEDRETPPTPPAGGKRTRFPDDWEPDEGERKAATDAGMDAATRRTEWARFRDYHVAHGKAMASWPAAWRTWCGNWREGFGRRLPVSTAPDPRVTAPRRCEVCWLPVTEINGSCPQGVRTCPEVPGG